MTVTLTDDEVNLIRLFAFEMTKITKTTSDEHKIAKSILQKLPPEPKETK
jgi:hypothetical protein